VWGIRSGAALGGFVLLVARRRKGWQFPVYPGEVMFALFGVEAAIEVFSYCFAAIWQLVAESYSSFFILYGLRACIQSLIMAGLFAWAASRMTFRRWRIMFFCTSGSYLVTYSLMCLGPALFFIAPLIADAVLLVVVVMDHRDGWRYPWTHWMGVILDLWSLPMMGVWIAVYARQVWGA
jgi:hypothetical protein